MLVAGFLGGTLGGALVAYAKYWALTRAYTSLEWAVGDLQSRASSFKGREMAEKRWKKAEDLDTEMARVLHGAPAAPRRYDNDPLG